MRHCVGGTPTILLIVLVVAEVSYPTRRGVSPSRSYRKLLACSAQGRLLSRSFTGMHVAAEGASEW
jgi:hypothetical protein